MYLDVNVSKTGKIASPTFLQFSIVFKPFMYFILWEKNSALLLKHKERWSLFKWMIWYVLFFSYKAKLLVEWLYDWYNIILWKVHLFVIDLNAERKIYKYIYICDVYLWATCVDFLQ